MTEMEELKKEISKLHQLITLRSVQDEKNREADDIWKDEMNKKIDPMYQIFVNAKGFGDIAVTLLKALVLLGAGVAVIVGLIKYLKS